MLFFFKQKTAYEMRISDWSSDVCSSDLIASGSIPAAPTTHQHRAGVRDSAEQMIGDILRKNDNQADPAIVRALCERSPEIIRVFEDDQIGRASGRERGCPYV